MIKGKVKNLIKHLAENSFSVFWGVSLTPFNTLKLFSAKCFIFLTLMINTFGIISRFFTQQFADINNFLCYCEALNKDGKTWLVFDVNPKPSFYTYKKFQRTPNFKCLPKKFLSDLVIKPWLLFLLIQIFCD